MSEPDYKVAFVGLFKAVALCEAPKGTQVDDVLGEYQATFCEATGLPAPACCEAQEDSETPLHGPDHDEDCENYDGAPVEQWEVTTPPDVYYTDKDYE